MFFKRKEIKRCEGTRDYLLRWRLVSCRGWGVYLHKFLADDGEDLHDHPWWFVSLILWRGYWEVTAESDGNWRRRKWPGMILFRPATWTHQVRLAGGPAWTLVVRGPVSRRWGFFVRGEWKHWKNYKEEC